MKKRPFNWGLVVVVVVIAAMLLAGWAFVTRQWATTPSETDLVGVWQRDDTGMRITIYPSDGTTPAGEDGPTGKITFTNVPEGILNDQGDPHADTTRLVTVSGTRDPFTDGSWGGLQVDSVFTLPDGTVNSIYSDGNGFFGYHLRLLGGSDWQYEYVFHRISTNPEDTNR